MKQRPPRSDDATSEEQAPAFDGTVTVQLDDTYRVRVVTNSETAANTIGSPTGTTNRKETTDRLRALEPADNATTSELKPLAESGDDPDATGVFVLPTIGR
jgi:hypothetical protein